MVKIDAEKSLTDYIWSRLTDDATLQGIMGGTVRLYLTWAKEDAAFPYLVHRLEIRKEPGAHPVQAATHYLDIWHDGDDADTVFSIRERLMQLLGQLDFNTDDVSLVSIEWQTGGFVAQAEQGIWHYATMWEWTFRRDTEATAIEGR